jgi:acyl-[acyl-carrier-protein]-phospholipid O-acyltransferase/long-chain-fatty-acid--[acyl-carrier-protein] ligase
MNSMTGGADREIGAMVVPVHIDGAEATMFSRLTREQARGAGFKPHARTYPSDGDDRQGAADGARRGALSDHVDLVFRAKRRSHS